MPIKTKRFVTCLSMVSTAACMLAACEDKPASPAAPADAPKAAPAAKPAPAPATAPLAIKGWGVDLAAPVGAKVTEMEEPDEFVQGTATIDLEAACGTEIKIYRYEKSGLDAMFKNATGPSGNKDDQFPVKTKDENGFKVLRSWVIPLGDTMWSAQVGHIIGDHLLQCGDDTIGGLEKKQADCVFAVCKTLKKSGS